MECEATCTISYNISYDLAVAVIAAGVEEARKRGVALSFAVVDPAGNLVSSARMDGAPFSTIDIARGKAFASAATGGQPGDVLAQRYLQNPMVWGNVGPLGQGAPMLPARGSLPLRLEGRLVGSVGASGAPPEIDEQVIAVAAAAIGAA